MSLPILATAALAGTSFLNSGTVRSTDKFGLVTVDSIYNEDYSYEGTFGGSGSWTRGGLPYLYKMESGGNNILPNTDMPGGDIDVIPNLVDYEACLAACNKNQACTAWTFDKTSGCYLKKGSPPTQPKQGVTSGCKPGGSNACGVRSVPPSGMRSSVPLGGLAAGGIELRGDGRIGDWGIALNNGPQAFQHAGKFEDNNWMMGVAVNDAAVAVRTHPPQGVDAGDAIAQMTYRGAFPVSQLSLEDHRVNASGAAVLNAFSHFEMNSPKDSSLPVINFEYSFPAAAASEKKSLFMNIPESLFRKPGVSVSVDGATAILKGGVNDTAGEIAVMVLVDGKPSAVAPTWIQSPSVATNWQQFKDLKGVLPSKQESGPGQVGVAVSVPNGQNVTLVFGYYFPDRHWGSENIGQFYASVWGSAKDVVSQSATNIQSGKTDSAITAWNRLCTDNSLPTWLRDALTQTGGGLGKTSMFLKDGRYRQYESHSCAQMEPPHIHFYRALLYTSVFPTLEEQTVDMYASTLPADGDVQELFGCGCGGCGGGSYNLDQPMGGPRGDDTSLFLIDNYMNYKWHGKSLAGNWAAITRAVNWVTGNAQLYGLPHDLRNTFDEHGIVGNTNSYSAFVFLTGMAATKEMALVMKNDTMHSLADAALTRGADQLQKQLWTGSFYRSFWCANGNTDPTALQGDSTYGYLWSALLDLDIGVNMSMVKSHIERERMWNLNDYGIMFASNRTYSYDCKGKGGLRAGFADIDTWTMMAMDHASVGIHVGADVGLSMGAAQNMIDSYRLLNNDQWDIRDLSSRYSDAIESEPSRPTCNSHYTRQTIMWAIPMMLSGQQWNFASSTLSLKPVDSQTYPKLPVFASGASMIATFQSNKCVQLEVLSTPSTATATVSNLVVDGVQFTAPGTLKTGDVKVYCSK